MATIKHNFGKESVNNLDSEWWSNQQPGDRNFKKLMASEEYNYLELPNGQLELIKPLGWEEKRLHETETVQLL